MSEMSHDTAKTTPCRRDCVYFSTYTETCDYTLMSYRARPCAASACTEYKMRTERRSWSIFTGRQPRDVFATADCGHEVYVGERLYVRDEKTACLDCVKAELEAFAAQDLARLLGYGVQEEVR